MRIQINSTPAISVVNDAGNLSASATQYTFTKGAGSPSTGSGSLSWSGGITSITLGSGEADTVGQLTILALDGSNNIVGRLQLDVVNGDPAADVYGVVNSRLPSALVAGRMDCDVGGLQSFPLIQIQSGLATSSALGTVSSNVSTILGRLPTTLVSGRMDVSIGALQSGIVTSIQSGLATASSLTTVGTAVTDVQSRLPAALVSGKMDSSVGALQTGIVSSIQSGLATSSALTTVGGNVTTALGRLPTTLVSGRMDVSIGAVQADAIAAAGVAADAVTKIQSGLATSSEVPTATAIADATLDRADAFGTGFTFRKLGKLFMALLGGKRSGGGTATIKFRDPADTKDVITITGADSDGNATGVTLNP